jgi:hypothetical protein
MSTKVEQQGQRLSLRRWRIINWYYFFADVDGQIAGGGDKLAQGGWKTTKTTGQEEGEQ